MFRSAEQEEAFTLKSEESIERAEWWKDHEEGSDHYQKQNETTIESSLKKGSQRTEMNIRTKDGRCFSRARKEPAEEQLSSTARKRSTGAVAQTEV